MKPLIWIGLTLAALTGAVAWQHFVHDPGLLAQASAKLSDDSLDRALKAQVRVDSIRFKRDSVIERQVIRTIVRVDTVLQRATVAESVFVQELPDTLRPAFQALEALKDSAVAGLKLVIVDQQRQIALRDTAMAELHVALVEALKQRDRWMKLARPGFFLGFLRDLPKIAIAAGAGLIAGRELPH